VRGEQASSNSIISPRRGSSVGRSAIRAKATVLKRDGRTKIDATIDAPQLDFDDLADDAGLAAARAKEARIGPRILPDTRINLEKMGPTDGTIRVSIASLLVKGGSVFKSLSGTLKLDHRVLRLPCCRSASRSACISRWTSPATRQSRTAAGNITNCDVARRRKPV
jgi:hypothetical protein